MSAAVSVVVPYYRAQADLDRLTAALAAQRGLTGGLQLVVADDGSPVPPRVDPGLPFDVVTVRQRDRGFRASAARALGAEAADGDVLAFLDGDMLPEPGYLAAALAAVATAPRDAAVVGRRRHLAEAWLERAWADGWRPGDEVPESSRLAEPAWLGDGYRATDDLRRADSTGYRYVISAVLTMAREVYEDAGGFDPAFVGYGGEDWELAHRLWRVGAALRHAPDAVAWQAGADFGGRGDTAEAARVKAREALVLASRIPATTARGHGLSLAGPLRVEARVRVPEGADGAAAAVVAVDAVLRAAPGARVGVVGGLDEAAARALGDPRVRLLGEPDGGAAASQDLPPTPARGDLDAVRSVPDWSVDVHVPLRPAAAGARPDADAVAAWLLRLERAGVERVEVLGEPGERAGVRGAGTIADRTEHGRTDERAGRTGLRGALRVPGLVVREDGRRLDPSRGRLRREDAGVHEDEGRRRHYGHFYGLEDLPEGDLLLVWGNCQGESYRRLLGGEPGTPLHGADLVSVRVPPAFEAQPDEVEHLERLLPRVKALVTQPIPHDYRGMPIGTDQLVARLPKDAAVVRIPVVYDVSRFPWQVTLRNWKFAPGEAERPGEDPPVVPYHDLRVLAEAATGRRREVAPAAIREAAAASVQALRAREEAKGTLSMADLVAAERGVGFYTVNHPTNMLLTRVAERVAGHLPGAVAVQPVPASRVLLGGVRAPLEAVVVEALDLDAEPTEDWTVAGQTVPAEQLRQTHLDWYAQNPQAVEVGMRKYADQLRLLGLAG
ncbi:WcbI family polysaccharide biosynthesis putative acetyltransferase [Micrococcus sp. KRD070]|uniref:WcbI family polysaccharide biosynthesis putative acetyltransferase n=1 Tax=Micrococcus sp. KRD070 TaxID=2729719 RepID=UPI00314547B1